MKQIATLRIQPRN
uniref:Uncharacterized protein n=1 Tax=Timema poppense TaxID=170557 RepID=A0A7R9DIN7_TIMPO|nr:unnamed protein product [Timema poppensis]